MILFIDSYDYFSRALLAQAKTERLDYISVDSKDFIDHLSVARDINGDYWLFFNKKVYITAFYSVCCGFDSNIHSVTEYINDCSENYYLLHSWEMYLKYVLHKVPVVLGMLRHDLSIGTFLQLPFLYKILSRYNLSVPKTHFFRQHDVLNFELNNRFYYKCASLFCRDYTDFVDDVSCPVFFVEKIGLIWGKLVVIGENIFLLYKAQVNWQYMKLDTAIQYKITQFVQDFSLLSGEFIVRVEGEELIFYAFTPHISKTVFETIPDILIQEGLKILRKCK